MTTSSIRVLFCAGLMVFAMLGPATVLAAGTNFSCSPAKVKGQASTVTVATSSTNFVNVAETQVGFVQGGVGPSCVLVRFSAETLAAGTEILFIRAFLDDTTAALPASVRYSAQENVYRARAYDFVFPNVAPGAHTLRMQYKGVSGTSVNVGPHTTIVFYK